MKKLISLILMLCLAALAVPAMADPDITGTWYGTEMQAGGATYQLSTLGMAYTMTLNPLLILKKVCWQ